MQHKQTLPCGQLSLLPELSVVLTQLGCSNDDIELTLETIGTRQTILLVNTAIESLLLILNLLLINFIRTPDNFTREGKTS